MGMNERRVSKRKEIDGIPCEYDGFRVTLARAGGHNKDYLKLMEDQTKPVRKALELGYVGNEKAEQWFKTAYAKTVIKNWEVLRGGKWVVGMDDLTGKDPELVLPFNEANVLAFLQDDSYHDYFEDFLRMANEPRLFREMRNEADLGN